MNPIDKRIEKVGEVITDWLRPDNRDLKNAIDRTIDENLFSFEDIKHQIRHLRDSLTCENLKKWAVLSDLNYNALSSKMVLCLHAGNLPLVGLQDLLAVVLTGGSYCGKISKKDPYLIPTLLELIQEKKILKSVNWSTVLDDLSNIRAEALLFAGSKSSAEIVREKLIFLNMINQETPHLLRTAHFSIALIEDNQKGTMEDLTEAVFRYGGTGCRSVAIVVAPFHLNSYKCSFTDFIELFWMRNPQHKKPPKALEYRFAYNKAVGIDQSWLNDFLVEEYQTKPDEKFILQWIKGDVNTLGQLIGNYDDGLQSVYSTNRVGSVVVNRQFEPLSEAQTPPIWWKPDAVDTIEWLQTNV